MVAFHLRHEVRHLFPGEHTILDPILRSGFLGVDLFFVLSGFVIALNYFRRLEDPSWEAYGSFLRRRLARIYPAYLVALLATLGVVVAFEWLGFEYYRPSRFDPGAFIESVFMVQSWTYPAEAHWNIPDWSVSAEWLAYLSFPAFVWVARRPKNSIGIGLCMAILLGIFGALVLEVGRDSAMELAIVRVAGGFGLGVLLFRAYDRAPPRSAAWLVIALVLLLSVPVAYAASKSAGLDPLVWAPVWFAPVVFGLASPAAQNRLTTNRPVLYLGRISYSVYLIHDVWLLGFRAAWHPRELADAPVAARIGYLTLDLVAIIVLAHLLHRFVEQPWRDRLAGRRSLPDG